MTLIEGVSCVRHVYMTPVIYIQLCCFIELWWVSALCALHRVWSM